MDLLRWSMLLIRGAFVSRTVLVAENLALRQQLAVFKRTRPRPKFKLRDRLLRVVLRAAWTGWRSALMIVEPATACRRHRAGFRLF